MEIKERTPKIAKRRVEAKMRNFCEAHGYTYIRANWKKGVVHYLTPTGHKVVEMIRYG